MGMDDILRSPITGLIIAFILAAISASGKLSMNLSTFLLITAFLIGCYEISHLRWVIHLRIILCFLLGIGLTLISWWTWPTPELKQPTFIGEKEIQEKTPPKKSQPKEKETIPPKDSPAWPIYQARQHLSNPKELSLYDLFLTDFPGVQRIGETWKIKKDKDSLKVSYFSVIDLEFQAKVLTFYIPNWRSMYDLCVFILDQIESKKLTIPEAINMKQKAIGDSTISSSQEAKFSGRVFIYHETELSAEEIGDLTKLYKSKGLNVQFRGSSYLSSRRNKLKED